MRNCGRKCITSTLTVYEPQLLKREFPFAIMSTLVDGKQATACSMTAAN